MKFGFYAFLILLFGACSSPKEKTIEAIDLKGLQNCWKARCSQEQVSELYGSPRPDSQVRPEVHQWVYFGDKPSMTPFTSFNFNSDGHVIHMLHIPKRMHMNRIVDLIPCNWMALENSPYVSRQMNDEVTKCEKESITVHYNAVTQQVIKILWGKVPQS